MSSLFRRLRIRQIQICSKCFRRLSAIPALFVVIKAARELPIVHGLLAAILGYLRPFATMSEASAAISGYEGGGHSNPQYLGVKVPEAERPRPGDYEALYHIQRVLPQVRTVFDLGGSVGNLFFGYSRFLDFSPDMSWIVCDLPPTNALGEEYAKSRNELRLRFTERLSDSDGADLFIISGALHYFERPLPAMLAELTTKPNYVLINRAPLVDGPSLATVQDGGSYRLACMLHSLPQLIAGLQSLGYEMIDAWQIRDRSVIIPCYPDRSAGNYSGIFFRLHGAPAKNN